MSEDRERDDIKNLSSQRVDVNAWRSLFLTNELNELQTYKIINGNFTLLVYAVLMEGFGFKYWTSSSPKVEFVNHQSPLNFSLFFFETTFIFYVVAAI